MSEYFVVIEHEGESWGAYCPDLPGVGVVGESQDEVERLIRDAITFHLDGLRRAGEPIPEPTAVGTTLVEVPAQTQASRDGGVDCVAYHPRPIFGGKVVIQAKRYKHTVGVSAVRDLYGTMQNEGASKGILVTTSGYGKSSFEFSEGKPLELLSGTHLLYLLAEHAGIEARIEPPELGRPGS